MGFTCCNCSKNDLFKSTIMEKINNQNEKPIENRNINEEFNNDSSSINSINNNSLREIKTPESTKNNINNSNILYNEEGIIDSLIRMRDK